MTSKEIMSWLENAMGAEAYSTFLDKTVTGGSPYARKGDDEEYGWCFIEPDGKRAYHVHNYYLFYPLREYVKGRGYKQKMNDLMFVTDRRLIDMSNALWERDKEAYRRYHHIATPLGCGPYYPDYKIAFRMKTDLQTAQLIASWPTIEKVVRLDGYEWDQRDVVGTVVPPIDLKSIEEKR